MVLPGQSKELLQDLAMHAAEHWRMVLPGQHSGLEDFVVSLTSGLRARPFGKPCLDHALSKLAPELDLDSLWLEFGVWTGQSLGALGRRSLQLGRRPKVFGFDSFKGLPENWRSGSANSSGVLSDAWAKRWTMQGSFDLGVVQRESTTILETRGGPSVPGAHRF